MPNHPYICILYNYINDIFLSDTYVCFHCFFYIKKLTLHSTVHIYVSFSESFLTLYLKIDLIILNDHARFKSKCTICNSIMWFIFNLHRKNKHSEVTTIHFYKNGFNKRTHFEIITMNYRSVAGVDMNGGLSLSHVFGLLLSLALPSQVNVF
jgi:hypothetical protein